MIILLDGIMGSGKSYYAVDYIHKNKDKYFKVYTNIDGFKYSDNVEELKFSWFEGVINDLKLIYDDESTSDQDLWNHLYNIGFLNSNQKDDIKPVLFVFDEAHNFFDKKSDLLTWFITYHRHFFIDAILITQTYNLIHYSYHKLFENIIHAIPASRRLFNSKFKYQKHIKLPISDGKNGTYSGDIYLKKDPKVFAMYQSGDKVRTKSYLHKYIYYLVGFLVLGFFAFYYLRSQFTPDKSKISKQDINTTTKSKHYKNISTHSFSFDDKKYLIFKCVSNSCVSVKKDIDISFDIDDLQTLLTQSDSTYLRSRKINKDFAYVYLLVTDEFLKFFKKRSDTDEKGFHIIN